MALKTILKNPENFKLIQSNSNPEYLDSLMCDPIKLRGKPKSLKGSINLTNNTKSNLWVQDLSFTINEGGKNLPLNFVLSINTCIHAGETKQKRIKISLPDETPSGYYTGYVTLGNQRIDLTCQVQNNLKLEFFPKEFIAQGVIPGGVYEFQFEIKNTGNLDFVIPELNHSIIIDMQYICKAKSLSAMNEAAHGFEAFLDGVAKRINNKYLSWIKVSTDKPGEVIGKGETNSLKLTIQLEKEIDKNSSYFGEIVLGKNLIKYQLIA